MNDTDRAPRQSGRIPPHNLNAEESVLGAVLLSSDAINAVAEINLVPGDFYKPGHQHIYDAVRALVGSGEPVDAVTVADELRRHGLLELVGGIETLHSLQNATPAISNAHHYARIVQDTSLLRRLIHVGSEISEIGFTDPDDARKAVDKAESKMFELGDGYTPDSTRPLSELVPKTMDHLEQRYELNNAITGMATGFDELDELLSGLQPSTLNIVGARPAMGKTAFGLGMATYIAQNSGLPVLVFSLEMGQLELTQRILSSEARVDSQKLRTGNLNEADWAKIGTAVGRLEVPLYLDDNPRVTVMEIRAKARRIKARDGLGLVVVDYLQLMSGSDRAENRQLEISEISRNLKILARELEVPIVALSQLSRGLESRHDKKPMLSDLRESGSLEQDADVVMFLYREEVYSRDDPSKKGLAEVIVAKHRSGPIGDIQLVFHGHYTRFDNISRRHTV